VTSPRDGRLTGVEIFAATLMPASGPTGVQTHLKEACDFLASQGNTPTVVTPRCWGGPLSIPVFGARIAIDRVSAPASVAWYRYWHYVFLREALRKSLSRAGDAVVYAQCALAAKAAMKVRSGPHQKVVVAIHSDGSQADEWVDKKMLRVGSPLYRSIVSSEQEILPSVDGIVYVSEAARAGMARHVRGLERLPFAVVPNFISVRAPIQRDEKDRRDLVMVGGLEIHKNHEYLLRVLAAARQRGKRYTLDLIGDGPCRAPLGARSEELGIASQVRFLGSRSDARSLLAGYRVYVHTSRRESLCMAIIEAMAYGLPVVAGPTGGIPELFEPGTEGLFWPLDDPDAASEVLVGLMGDEALRRKMGAAGRERFERSFDSAVVGPRLCDLLGLVTRSGTGNPDPQQRNPIAGLAESIRRDPGI
jgi:glycosyltransferase involved in cell wall biosynthesis